MLKEWEKSRSSRISFFINPISTTYCRCIYSVLKGMTIVSKNNRSNILVIKNVYIMK